MENINPAVLPKSQQWVTFRLNNGIYGINVLQVQEVLKISKLSKVPGAPDYILGMINLRGKVVTVIDTRKRFGLSTLEITEQNKIIIIETEQQILGLMVDNVAEVIEIDPMRIDSAPKLGDGLTLEFMQGICEYNGTLLILIDVNKLLTEVEWQEIAKM